MFCFIFGFFFVQLFFFIYGLYRYLPTFVFNCCIQIAFFLIYFFFSFHSFFSSFSRILRFSIFITFLCSIYFTFLEIVMFQVNFSKIKVLSLTKFWRFFFFPAFWKLVGPKTTDNLSFAYTILLYYPPSYFFYSVCRFFSHSSYLFIHFPPYFLLFSINSSVHSTALFIPLVALFFSTFPPLFFQFN